MPDTPDNTPDPAQPELPVIYATLNVRVPPDDMNKLINADGGKQGEADDRKL